MTMKRGWIAAIVLILTCLAQPIGAAEVSRILVGFPAGQATDIVARLIAERLGPVMGENFIVENRPGQGGSLVLNGLKQLPPDGRAIVLAPLASLVANPHLYKSVGYDTLKDFAPIALVVDLPIVLVVKSSLPVKNVSDLVAYAKANPDKLAYASAGIGTLSHLGMEDFKRRTMISMLHVPYRGSPPAMTDLIAGNVDLAMDTVTVTQPFIQSGQLRLIASAYSQRIPAFPDTPTVAEQGFGGVGLAAWLGFVAPAGTPKERINKLSEAILKVVGSPEVTAKFVTLGVLPKMAEADEFGAFIEREYGRWGAIVKESGATVN
jgi:tripartite-type tricarboxylate transporter receptor subunit TctC